MAWYRLYFMDAFSGHIHKFHEYEAADDETAISAANDWRGQSRCELWSGRRKVKSWPPSFDTPDEQAAE